MIKRSWTSLCAGAALIGAMAAVSVAGAEEVYTAGATDERCQNIFSDSNDQLSIQLASLSCCKESTCCAPGGCCAPEGCSTAACCGDALAGYGDGCGSGGCGGGGCSLFGGGCESDISFGGWVQFGYHSGVTPAATTRNDAAAFNNHPHRFNLHQGWLFAEKVADGSNGLDFGFRMDLMYGVDASDTQAFGNPAGSWDNGGSWTHGAGYGFALPQLYAEMAVGDLSIKAGHFYTLVGYEVVTAPDNFFYSHSLTMFNSEPFTHTGVLATYSASDSLTLYGGWTAGWDTGFDQLNDGSSFLGGISKNLSDDVTLTYIATAGELGWRGNGYSHSVVLDMALTDELNYVIQSDVVRTNLNGGDDDVGINQYVIYALSDKIGAGMRSEWWKNEGVSQYAFTYGLNIKPTDNLIIRPELRHDWDDPNVGSESTFGVDAILTF